jgi:2-polyprenyl-6-methoxyphenol hydroxylase-like FAD-dependent oxidoreductase
VFDDRCSIDGIPVFPGGFEMKPIRTVLISGCSIAGPCLAYWLREHGFVPTIVERSPVPRPGGQAIDVRGKALGVLERMGLLHKARALRTTLKGVSVQDKDGNETWRSEEMTFSGGRFDANDVEILRDDLAGLLANAVVGVESLYGDSISAICEKPDGIEIELRSGERMRRFDLVVGADGLHSNVRRLTFGDERPFLHETGTGIAVFTIPNYLELSDWQIVHGNPGYGYAVYTARENRELRIAFGFPATTEDECQGNIDAQKMLVAHRMAGFGWEVPRFLAEMKRSADFYFGAVAQVKMDRWSNGRVVLTGDAAYCPSPLSGQGTSLALVGAYILAAELAEHRSDYSAAFGNYEARMRPYVALNQALIDEEHGASTASQRLDEAKDAISL